MKLKQGCTIHSDYGLNISAESYVDAGIPIIRTSDFDDYGSLDLSDTKCVEPHVVGGKIIRKGDVIFSRSGTIGRAMIFNYDIEATYAAYLVRFRPNPKKLLSDFIGYWAQSADFWHQIRSDTIQSTIGNFNANKFSNLSIPNPDPPTQRRIADFLDRETARIDLLIEKKQRLVAVLNEKRSAEIAHAITGGTSFDDEMEKGVRGRGAAGGGGGVRKHPLRHLSQIANSNVDKVIVEGERSVRLCNYVDVYKNDFITVDMPFSTGSATDSEVKRFGLKSGDVIITKDSEDRNDIGVPAYVCETADDMVCGYHLTLLRADTRICRGDFLFWALKAKPLREACSIAANGITRYGLTQEGIRSLRIPVPDLPTQRRIADFLDRETARIDALKDKTNESIDRLKEYRAALITAAVTGQIDVDSHTRSGATDRRLDSIQEELGA